MEIWLLLTKQLSQKQLCYVFHSEQTPRLELQLFLHTKIAMGGSFLCKWMQQVGYTLDILYYTF